MSLSNTKKLYPYLTALFAVIIWSSYPALIKDSIQNTSIYLIIPMRYLIPTLILMREIRNAFYKFSLLSKQRLIGFVAATIAVIVSQVYALENIPATWYIAAYTLVPVIFLFSNKSSLNFRVLIGCVLATIGMIIFLYTLHESPALNLWDIGLLIFSMLSWVMYSLLAKKCQSEFRDKELVGLTNFIGLIAGLTIWSFHGLQIENATWLGVSIAVSTGITSTLALIAYSYSLRYKPIFALYSQYLEPVFGLALATILLGERLTFSQSMASIIIISGALVVAMTSHSTQADY